MNSEYVLIVQFQDALYQCPAPPIYEKKQITFLKVVDILYDNKVILNMFSKMCGYLSFYKRFAV